LRPCSAAQVNAAGRADATKSRRNVDGVAPKVEAELGSPDDAGDDRANVNADSDLPSGWTQLGGLSQAAGTAEACHHRIVARLEQVCRCEDPVTDGLDLVEAMLHDHTLPSVEQVVQVRDDLLRTVLLAVWREVDNISEQYGHPFIPHRHYAACRL